MLQRSRRAGVSLKAKATQRPGELGRQARIKNMAISETDIKRLWGKAAGLCSHPECNTDCLPFLDLDDPTVVGEMAHVIARKEKGPRGRAGGGDDTYANLIYCSARHITRSSIRRLKESFRQICSSNGKLITNARLKGHSRHHCFQIALV
jgi:hypothetical protein